LRVWPLLGLTHPLGPDQLPQLPLGADRFRGPRIGSRRRNRHVTQPPHSERLTNLSKITRRLLVQPSPTTLRSRRCRHTNHVASSCQLSCPIFLSALRNFLKNKCLEYEKIWEQPLNKTLVSLIPLPLRGKCPTSNGGSKQRVQNRGSPSEQSQPSGESGL